ncbi:MAG: type II toxin-antitoxin system RelE/ParE family toxin [Bacteroidota bacterium]
MAKKRKVVLTKLANEQITYIYQQSIAQEGQEEAQILMDDFLDVAFTLIAAQPSRFPICLDKPRASATYRMAVFAEDYRIIFQILTQKILIVLIHHEEDLPF